MSTIFTKVCNVLVFTYCDTMDSSQTRKHILHFFDFQLPAGLLFVRPEAPGPGPTCFSIPCEVLDIQGGFPASKEDRLARSAYPGWRAEPRTSTVRDTSRRCQGQSSPQTRVGGLGGGYKGRAILQAQILNTEFFVLPFFQRVSEQTKFRKIP